MTDLSSAAAWLLHAMEVHAWRACLAHGGDARAVRYTVGTWDRGVKTDYPPTTDAASDVASSVHACGCRSGGCDLGDRLPRRTRTAVPRTDYGHSFNSCKVPAMS